MNLRFKENISQVKHIFGIFLEHSKAEQHTERKKLEEKEKVIQMKVRSIGVINSNTVDFHWIIFSCLFI